MQCTKYTNKYFGTKQCFDADINGTADSVQPDPKSVMGKGAKIAVILTCETKWSK